MRIKEETPAPDSKTVQTVKRTGSPFSQSRADRNKSDRSELCTGRGRPDLTVGDKVDGYGYRDGTGDRSGDRTVRNRGQTTTGVENPQGYKDPPTRIPGVTVGNDRIR